MKMFFDFFPIFVLFGTYLVCMHILKMDETAAFTLGAYTFTASAWILVAYSFFANGKVEAMHWFLAILATIGALIIAVSGDSFLFKFKSSIMNWLLAAIMLATLFIGKQTLLQRLMGDKIEAPNSAWRQLTMVVSICFILLGLANLYVILEQGDGTWVYFKLISSVVLTLVMFIAGGKIMWPYLQEMQRQQELADAAQQQADETQQPDTK